MAKIHIDDRFLDFDAIGGWDTLQNTVVSEMPAKFTRLVLPIGDADPDESYSSVAYEKGFNLLYILEKRVGEEEFKAFFQSYLKNFQTKPVDSEEFKTFFLQHFAGITSIEDFDWHTWFYGEGMPPETPLFDRTLSGESEHLASLWLAVDRDGRMLPNQNIKKWTTLQITCFLDTLKNLSGKTPLKIPTLNSLNRSYRFTDSGNSEVLFRYIMMCVTAEDAGILGSALYFATSNGRMKFVRPLYKALYNTKMGREPAITTFLRYKDIYHPIAAKMIASDLMIGRLETETSWNLSRTAKWTAGIAAVVGVCAIVLMRQRSNLRSN
jgi:leukotriene-A4 hydrolase